MIKYKYNLILLNLMHSTKERKLYVHFVQKNNNIISKELLHFVIALLYYKNKKNCYKINLYMRNRLKTKNICGIIKALFK